MVSFNSKLNINKHIYLTSIWSHLWYTYSSHRLKSLPVTAYIFEINWTCWLDFSKVFHGFFRINSNVPTKNMILRYSWFFLDSFQNKNWNLVWPIVPWCLPCIPKPNYIIITNKTFSETATMENWFWMGHSRYYL